MNTISITYTLKWQHKTMPQYQMSTDKKLFNVNRGRLVKCTLNGGVVGWWIGRTFLPKSKVNENFMVIKKEKLPF